MRIFAVGPHQINLDQITLITDCDDCSDEPYVVKLADGSEVYLSKDSYNALMEMITVESEEQIFTHPLPDLIDFDRLGVKEPWHHLTADELINSKGRMHDCILMNGTEEIKCRVRYSDDREVIKIFTDVADEVYDVEIDVNYLGKQVFDHLDLKVIGRK